MWLKDDTRLSSPFAKTNNSSPTFNQEIHRLRESVVLDVERHDIVDKRHEVTHVGLLLALHDFSVTGAVLDTNLSCQGTNELMPPGAEVVNVSLQLEVKTLPCTLSFGS